MLLSLDANDLGLENWVHPTVFAFLLVESYRQSHCAPHTTTRRHHPKPSPRLPLSATHRANHSLGHGAGQNARERASGAHSESAADRPAGLTWA